MIIVTRSRGKSSTAVGDENESPLGSAARTGEAKGVFEDPADGTQSANESPGPTLRITVGQRCHQAEVSGIQPGQRRV
jgi:hypothetical protein